MKLFNQIKGRCNGLRPFTVFNQFNTRIMLFRMLALFVIFAGLLRVDSWIVPPITAQAQTGVTGDIDDHKPMLAELPQLEDSPSRIHSEASLSINQLQTDLVLMVSIPGFSFLEMSPESMQWMPALRQISETGKLAALNVRTPERGIEDVYLTINAGAPAIAPLEAIGYQRMDDVAGMTEEKLLSEAFDVDAMKKTDLEKYMPSQGNDQRSRFLIDSYTRYTGKLITGHQIVVPNIGYLTMLNKTQTYDSHIGRLGDVLLANGVRTAVFANRQATEISATGSAPLMLMTSEGTVASGNLSDGLLVYDPSSPGNVRTDTARLIQAIKDYIQDDGKQGDKHLSSLHSGIENTGITPTVVLIEYGDWHRLDQERRYYEEERWLAARKSELVKLDRFLAELLAITDDAANGQLWIWSPLPHTQAAKEKLHVTPFIQYEGLGLTEQYRVNGIAIQERLGLLTSATTKRAGIISIHDLGPTLLASLAIEERDDWTGFPLTTVSTPNAYQQLLTDVSKMQHVYELRTIVVIPFVMIEIVVLLLSLLFVLLKRRKALTWMRLPLFSLLSAPLCILLLGLVPQLEPRTQLVILLLMVTAISFIAVCFAAWKSILAIAAITSAVLLVDGLLGAPLVKYSIMGYDPMIGARYYGIGNEYMGVLVGSAILTCVLAVQQWTGDRNKHGIITGGNIASDHAKERRTNTYHNEQLREITERPTRLQARRRTRMSRQVMATVTLAGFLAITLYMAAPGGGTNAGGALTASVAFGITWFRLFGSARLQRVNIWHLFGAGFALLAAGLIVLWIMNQWLMPSGDQDSKSHIGRAMDLLVSGRFDVIFGMIVRKLQMNLHLIGVSSWGKVLLTSIFVMAVLLLKPRGMLNEWQETRPYWMSGFTAIIIGSIVALALNDSGIVAAGTMIVFAAAPMLLFISEQMPSRSVSQLHRSQTDR